MPISTPNKNHAIFSVFDKDDDVPDISIPDPGYIYMASNPYFVENILKIGMTRKFPPSNRIKQLSANTATPGAYELQCIIEVPDCIEFESHVHIRLKKYRVSNNKEFFNIPWWVAIKILKQTINLHQAEDYSDWPRRRADRRNKKELEKLSYE